MGNADDARAQSAESLRSRVMTAYALCAIAESDLHAGEINRATQTAKTVRELIEEINRLASDVSQLSSSALRDLSEFSTELERRVQKIDGTLRENA